MILLVGFALTWIYLIWSLLINLRGCGDKQLRDTGEIHTGITILHLKRMRPATTLYLISASPYYRGNYLKERTRIEK